ncbi:MAG: hypothetical protein WCK02_04600 [Bacteroidota bacterium]
MRTIILLSILFTTNIYSIECFSQESTNKEKRSFTIKTSIIHYFSGEIPLSVEKFGKSNSFELGVSTIFPCRFWIALNSGLSISDPSRYYNKGFSLRAQYNLYLKTYTNNSKLYISPRLVYRHTWKFREKIYFNDSYYDNKNSFTIESDKQTIITLSFLVGKQFFIKNYTFDIYGGPGVCKNTVYDKFDYNKNTVHRGFGFSRVQPTLSLGAAIGFAPKKKKNKIII